MQSSVSAASINKRLCPLGFAALDHDPLPSSVPACVLLPDRLADAPAMPLNSSKVAEHRDKIPVFEYPFPALVARTVTKKERESDPKALAALQLEWDKLQKRGVWDESKVTAWDIVVARAKKTGWPHLRDLCREE